MKIFSSFDTNFKNEVIEREGKKYWRDSFMVVSYGRFYYLFFVLIPWIFLVVWTIVYIFLMIYFAHLAWEMVWIYYLFLIFLLLILLLPALFRFIKKYIDYILDFVVVNPYSMIYYNQEWIFNRKWRTVEVDKIKTVTVRKDTFMKSLFNYWSIVILTEWDDSWTWEINFHYIDDPDNIKTKIFDIINSKDDKFKERHEGK